jgi:ArsR family transcriptional regulator
MNEKLAVEKLAALAQETRLLIFRSLMEAGNDGMKAGAIGKALDLAPATLSFHLAHLERAGLVNSRPESRFIFYSVKYSSMDDLISYLLHNCCRGNACLPKTGALNSNAKRRRVVRKNVKG